MKLRGTISARMLEALLAGVARLGPGARRSVSEFVASQRSPAGGCVGPGGVDDIYYTLFGWMVRWALGERLSAAEMKGYLKRFSGPGGGSSAEAAVGAAVDSSAAVGAAAGGGAGLDLVHYAVWVRCWMMWRLVGWGRPGVVAYVLAPGGAAEPSDQVLARAPGGDPQAPYSRFLRLALAEDSGRGVTDGAAVLESLAAYRVPGGGFSNLRGATEASTSATAAAMIVRGQLAGYSGGVGGVGGVGGGGGGGGGDDLRALRDLQDSSGGFGAMAAAPVPDLLSTAVALFALRQWGVEARFPAVDFVEAHWLGGGADGGGGGGGFAATLLDGAGDTEYTFYGLLALGSL